jgi:tRNA (cmo5U34)-methyltransferase
MKAIKNEPGFNAYETPDRVASYDADMATLQPNRSRMIDIALEALPMDPAASFQALELGAGAGFFTKRFLDKYPHCRIIAIDGSESMTALAKERLGNLAQRVDFRIADFRRLRDSLAPTERGLAAFSSYALHHLNAPEKAGVLREVSAFLEPGGWFVNADLICAEGSSMEERLMEIKIRRLVARLGGTDDRFRNPDAARTFVREFRARDGDQPLPITADLNICNEAGLAEASIFWLEFGAAVYGAFKPAR